LDYASEILVRFPQSSLDHFHIHREPSRLVNPSIVQNDTSLCANMRETTLSFFKVEGTEILHDRDFRQENR